MQIASLWTWLQPFQDLYAFQASRKSMGGRKVRRRGAPANFFAPSRYETKILAGWEISLFHAMTIVEELSRGDNSG